MEYGLLSLGEWIISHITPYINSDNSEELSEEEIIELQEIREKDHVWR